MTHKRVSEHLARNPSPTLFLSPLKIHLIDKYLVNIWRGGAAKGKMQGTGQGASANFRSKSYLYFSFFCLLFKVGVLAKRNKTKDALLQSEKGDGKSAWSFYSTNWDQRRKRISGLILFPKTLHPQKIVEECRPSCNWKAQRWNHDDFKKTTMWEFLWWITSPVEKTKVRVHFWGKTLFRPLFPHLK